MRITAILAYKPRSALTVADPLAPLTPQPPANEAIWFLVSPTFVVGPRIPEWQVVEYDLRVGDQLTVTCDRDGDKFVNVQVVEINGYKVGRQPKRELFTDMRSQRARHPSEDSSYRAVWLTNPKLTSNARYWKLLRAIEAAVVRVPYGYRIGVFATPEAGKTTVVRALQEAFLADRDRFNGDAPLLMQILVGERPEEITALADPRIETWAAPGDDDDERKLRVTFMAMERAKRQLELGRHVVIFIDSATRLARAINAAYSKRREAQNEGIQSGGMYAGSLEILNQFLLSGRKLDKGSLTMVATVLTNTSDRADEKIASMIKGSFNGTLKLQGVVEDGSRTVNLTAVGYPGLNIGSSTVRDAEFVRNGYPEQQGLSQARQVELNLAYQRHLRAVQAGDDSDEATALAELLQDLDTFDTNLDIYTIREGVLTPQQQKALQNALNKLMDRVSDLLKPQTLATWIMGRLRVLLTETLLDDAEFRNGFGDWFMKVMMEALVAQGKSAETLQTWLQYHLSEFDQTAQKHLGDRWKTAHTKEARESKQRRDNRDRRGPPRNRR